MKKYLTLAIIVFVCILNSCKKDSSDSGATISDDASAKMAFLQISSLWGGTLEPALNKAVQKYEGTVLSGASGGQAIVNGSYNATHASSSFSSTSTSTVDVTIQFQNYKSHGLTLNGTLRFYDFSESRSACAGGDCAFSNHSSTSYSSTNGSGVAQPPVSIQFSSTNDSILIKASKSDNSHWAITITNKNNQAFTFSY